MEKYEKEVHTLALFCTTVIWGVLGCIAFLNVLKSEVGGEPINFNMVGLLALSVVTIAGTLWCDATRRVIGGLWLLVGICGFMEFILGAGLDIQWMLDQSLGLLMIGLISGRIILLPESK